MPGRMGSGGYLLDAASGIPSGLCHVSALPCSGLLPALPWRKRPRLRAHAQAPAQARHSPHPWPGSPSHVQTCMPL